MELTFDLPLWWMLIPLTGFTQVPPLQQRGVIAVILTVVSLIFMWRGKSKLPQEAA